MSTIYLDNNATTPMLPEVLEAMAECAREAFANPASQHGPGREARRRLEAAREQIARLLGAETAGMRADRVVFTSGGTEANNLALLGMMPAAPAHVVVSAIEHPSVIGAAEELNRRGHTVSRLRVLPSGVVDLDHLAELLDRRTGFQPVPDDLPEARRVGNQSYEVAPALVSVMLGNNETGVLQPAAEIARLCRAAGALVHTDAVQAAGKIPVDFRALGVDAMTVAAHKFHGPRGIGALVVRPEVPLAPILFGGFQQAGLRPGTESPMLAVGMAQALELAHQAGCERTALLSALRDRFEEQLLAALPDVVINGALAPRLPHTSSMAFPGVDRQALVMALDLAGVACSTGSACASGSSEPSAVLVAMSCPPSVVSSALRFSFGVQNTSFEVDEAARRIVKAVSDLRRRK
jgi:cysteine desulfurase